MISNLSNSKMFVSAKVCRRNSKVVQLAPANIWNTSAIKIADVNVSYDDKMEDREGSSTFVLKLNWLAGVSVFKNVTWDQPRSQSPILNFEKSCRDLLVPVQMKSVLIPYFKSVSMLHANTPIRSVSLLHTNIPSKSVSMLHSSSPGPDVKLKKLSAFSRITNSMELPKRCILMNAFLKHNLTTALLFGCFSPVV